MENFKFFNYPSKRIHGVVLLILTSIFFSFHVSAQNALFYIEDFNVDGEGTSYTRSHIFDTTGSFFKSGSTSDFDGIGFTPTNIQNNNFLAMQNPDNGDPGGAAAGPSDGLCTLTIKDLIINNYDTVFLSYYLAAQNSAIYGPWRFANSGHYVNIEYQINSGSWTILSKVRNTNKSVFTSLYHTRRAVEVASTTLDTLLTANFRLFKDTIPNGALGDTLRVRFVFKGNDGAKMIALDKIRMRGQLVSALPSNRARLLYSYCGYTTNNINSSIWAVSDDGTPESYDFEISGGDLGGPEVVNKSIAGINLTDFTGLNYGQIYNVRVRGVYSGVPGAYSDSWFGTCQISINNDGPEMLTTCGTSRSLYENLYSEDMSGATNYRFRINGGTVYTTGGDRFFTLDDAGFSSNGSYDIEPAAFIGGAWTSYNSVCTYTVTTGAPTIALKSHQCGNTYNNINSSVWTANVPNATNYQWSITGGLTQTVSTGANPYLQLSDIPGMAYGVSALSIQVRVTVNAVTGTYGSSCSINIGSSVPSPNMQWVCGTSFSENKTIYSSVIGNASEYIFRISNGYDTVFARNANSFSFAQHLPTLGAGNYNIEARAVVGTDTSAYGNICAVTVTGGAKKGLFSNNTEHLSTSNYKFYPNPVKNGLMVESPYSNESRIVIYNIAGKTIIDKTIIGSEELDLSNLPLGQYQIRLLNDNLSNPEFFRFFKE
ncbi:MAG: T9SS type A sorting domain-containing protein [Cytophagales bacterium]